MWNWFNCYLSGRHDYSAWCESGSMFLRCIHCGRRSSGWAVTGESTTVTHKGKTLEQRAIVSAQRAARVSAVTQNALS